jgi:hypothetical protein
LVVGSEVVRDDPQIADARVRMVLDRQHGRGARCSMILVTQMGNDRGGGGTACESLSHGESERVFSIAIQKLVEASGMMANGLAASYELFEDYVG